MYYGRFSREERRWHVIRPGAASRARIEPSEVLDQMYKGDDIVAPKNEEDAVPKTSQQKSVGK